MDLHPASQEDRTSSPATVRVAVTLNHSLEDTWSALIDPDRLSCWLGSPDHGFVEGQPLRIAFGDGDFFLVTPDRIEPRRLVAFSWRFLGVGPIDRVRWEVRTVPGGTTVTVVDHHPLRDDRAARELTEGWTDFLGRLRAYLDDRRPARYGWRQEIDGSVELDSAGASLLTRDRLSSWLPITAGPGATVVWTLDEGDPTRLPVVHLDCDVDRVSFEVLTPDARRSTSALVTSARAGPGVRLSFWHRGFRELGMGDDDARILRRRFAASWVAALRRARTQHARSSSASPRAGAGATCG